MSKLQKKSAAHKRAIQHFKTWIFSTFVGHFCPPGSGSGSRIRIRIHWPDWIRIQSGSGSETLLLRIILLFLLNRFPQCFWHFVRVNLKDFRSVFVRVKINYPGFQDDEQKTDTDANSGWKTSHCQVCQKSKKPGATIAGHCCRKTCYHYRKKVCRYRKLADGHWGSEFLQEPGQEVD